MTLGARIAAGAVIVLVIAVLGAIIFGGPVIGFVKARWFAAEQKAETNADQAVSNAAETEAVQGQMAATTEFNTGVDTARNQTRPIVEQARADPTGKSPLPRSVVDRQRASYDVLCGQRPSICPGWVSPEDRPQP